MANDDEVVVTHFRSYDQHAMKWEKDGACWEQTDDGPWTRRPDYDFGTPNGDLLIDPWIQETLKDVPP